MNAITLGALALTLAGSPSSLDPAPDSVPLYRDLGNHHYPISTAEPLAQAYFDQGLRLYYAFNHAESIRAFEEAARRDPTCALCWWGKAVALGPNINAPMEPEAGEAARVAIGEARLRAGAASPRERALIEATAKRYEGGPGSSRAGMDSAYAQGLGEVVRQFPDDLEVATLYAEALMTLRPWSYWTREGAPEPGTDEVLTQLERVIEANPDHPGACHFFIHAVEAVHPERAVPCAERLAGLMPGAGHLVHMPGHIYIRVGRYMDAIRANEHAVHADETYIRDQRPGMGLYTVGYYPHNYDFMAFAAAMAGRRRMSVEAAERVASLIPPEFLAAPGLTMLQNYAVRTLQLRVRFGEWQEILATRAPANELLHARGIWHYARGRALTAQGDLPGARLELARLQRIAQNPALEGVTLDFNEARLVLGIAEGVLAGTIHAQEGRFDEAVRHLRDAAELEDGMVYGEPPEWSVPVRHDLGAVLLAAGRPSAAEGVYREDLRRFPENGWSLHGLARALREQGELEEAAQVEARFHTAWAGADVHLDPGSP
jgi:tetratricopeptide (TPR) repeat protein